MRNYLVVANQTLAGEQLVEEIRRRHAQEPSSFYVVVPKTPPKLSPSTGLGEALAGVWQDPDQEAADPGAARRATLEARNRLHQVLDRLQAEGVEASGDLGDPDPLDAIEAALTKKSFDEIIISTLPSQISKWLGMDLPHRAERKFKLPVTTVTGPS